MRYLEGDTESIKAVEFVTCTVSRVPLQLLSSAANISFQRPLKCFDIPTVLNVAISSFDRFTIKASRWSATPSLCVEVVTTTMPCCKPHQHDSRAYPVLLRNGLKYSKQRIYRISGSNPTSGEIFAVLERVRGRKYEVAYLNIDIIGSAKEDEAQAKAAGDVDAELSASHELIRGREGTLLLEPWDNDRFPQTQPRSVDEALRGAFTSERARKVYGLD